MKVLSALTALARLSRSPFGSPHVAEEPSLEDSAPLQAAGALQRGEGERGAVTGWRERGRGGAAPAASSKAASFPRRRRLLDAIERV